jgi:hypothetical protein
MPDEKGNVTEQEKADLSRRRGMAATQIADPEQRRKFIAAQGDVEATNKGQLPVEKEKMLSTESAIKGYKKGTAYVPKTGPAMLHKGEAVIPAEGNPMGLAESALAHGEQKAPPKPKKRIKEIRTRKAKSGGYIHEHHHTRPDAHPMEEHTSPDQAGMLAHMTDNAPNMGEPEGEQEMS